jgi:hypothetical protein
MDARRRAAGGTALDDGRAVCTTCAARTPRTRGGLGVEHVAVLHHDGGYWKKLRSLFPMARTRKAGEQNCD